MIQEPGLVRLSAQAGSPVLPILPNNNGTKCNDRISSVKVYFLYCIETISFLAFPNWLSTCV